MAEIFLDKISLSGILLDKIFKIINTYNNIYRNIRSGDLFEEDLSMDSDWQTCWQNLKELYDYIRFEYMDKLEGSILDYDNLEDRKNKTELVKNEIDGIFEKYKNPNQLLTFKDLELVYEKLLFVTTKIGLHSVSTGGRDYDIAQPSPGWENFSKEDFDDI